MSLVSVACCYVERPLPRADHSSRGDLSTVVCQRVFEEPHIGHPGPSRATELYGGGGNECFHQ